MVSFFGKRRNFLPVLSGIGRGKQRELLTGFGNCVENMIVGRVNRKSKKLTQGIWFRDNGLIGMIWAHPDTLNRGRVWINEFPGITRVVAPPQITRSRVDCFRVRWIKRKETYDLAQIKHSPTSATVVGNISSCHIAGYEHGIGVMGTDSWVKHCSAAAGTYNRKSTGASYTEKASSQRECKNQSSGGRPRELLASDSRHLILSFTFDILRLHFAARRSGLSIVNCFFGDERGFE